MREGEALDRADDRRLDAGRGDARGTPDRERELARATSAPRPGELLARRHPAQRLVLDVRGEPAAQDLAVAGEIGRVQPALLQPQLAVDPYPQSDPALADPHPPRAWGIR